MREKDTKVHDDYSSFSQVESERNKRRFRRFDVPELVFNLKNILSISENRLSSLYRKYYSRSIHYPLR